VSNRQSVRAAAVQISPDLESRDGTLDKLCDSVASAASQGAELVVFPETVVPYYPYFSFIQPPVASGREHMRLYEWAVEVPGPGTQRLAAAAKRHGTVLVVGVNERDHGSLYNTQLVFDADGSLLLKRRKLTPTFHERMIWGQGDGSGLKVVDTALGRLGTLACWEHYNPLARYALIAQHEELHCGQFPGSLVGQIFADQIEVTIRHHALEAGCFVINATGYLHESQVRSISSDPALQKGLRGGCMTAIVSPEGSHVCPPLTDGEGMLLADLDLKLITKRKRMMDAAGHYARPDLFRFALDDQPRELMEQASTPAPAAPRTHAANPELVASPTREALHAL
jgi:nitrilase